MDLTKSDFETYLVQLKDRQKINAMDNLICKILREWTEKELKKFPEPKKKVPTGVN